MSVTAYPPGTLVADAGPDQLAVEGEVTYLDASGTLYRGTGVLSYEWDFDDGSQVAYGEYVEHVYRRTGWFTVTVTVSDGQVEDADTCLVQVEEGDDPPVAVITPPGPVVGDRLTDVELTATDSTDDRGIVNLTWDMGDGTVISGWHASHGYAQLGIFPVTLTVEDTGGLIAVNRTTVEVRNLPPVIDDLSSPGEVSEGATAAFSVNASDPDGGVDGVGWDFDDRDGMSFEATGPRVTHGFGDPGTYNVTCIVRDDDGGQTVVHREVVVVREEEVDGLTYWYLVVIALVVIALLAAALSIKKRTNPDMNGPVDGQGQEEVGP